MQFENKDVSCPEQFFMLSKSERQMCKEKNWRKKAPDFFFAQPMY